MARLTATGLASRLGFSYDEVEDLRIAVDELCSTMLGDGGGVLTVVFSTGTDGLEVRAENSHAPTAADFDVLSEQILKAIVDNYEMDVAERAATFRMRHHA